MKNNLSANTPIEQLENIVREKNAVLGIMGLGYVGLPLAMASCHNGVNTIGFDLCSNKISALKNGKSYIGGISAEDIIRAQQDNILEVTNQLSDLKKADFILLCVPTPLTKNHTPDMSYVESACKMISTILRSGQTIILESTTYPGTTSDLMVPILEKSGLYNNKDFFVAYSPEREDPGNVNFSTHSIPKIIGADDPKILTVTADFYRQFIDTVIEVSSTKTAEAVKLLENIFRCVNIGLVNELKMIFDPMGIDIHEVIDAAATKPFGFMPFYPGPGIGGHCIPIDPLYLSWKTHEYKNSARFIKVATEVNQKMPDYTVQKFSELLNDQKAKSLNGANILVIGLAYKRNVSDLRESPAADIVSLLEKRKANLFYHDPFIKTVKNTEYANMKPLDWNIDNLQKMDGAIIVTDHDGIDWTLLKKHCLTYDTRGVMRKI